jgi:beta-glucanase (GH16 family)
MPDNQFHVYRVEIDRKSSNWRDQSITWFMDGKQVQRVTGNQINNQGVWTNIAQSPLYIILNVAMGGNWVSFVQIPVKWLTTNTDCDSPAPPTLIPGMELET